MKHTFKVTGMSCGGCTSTVEKTLNEITGITKATVSLPDNAVVEMDTHIATETMQEALSKAGNYTITEAHYSGKTTENKEGTSCCGGDNTPKKEEKTSCCGGGHSATTNS